MNELIQILYAYLSGDEGPEIYDEDGELLGPDKALEVAQQLAEHIVASGWPKAGA